MTEQEIGYIERDMRRSLERYTHKARVRGDFIEAILTMHSRVVRFLRVLRLIPLVAALSIVLVVATLFLLPGTDRALQPAARAGQSLTVVLDGVANAVGGGATSLFDLGAGLADSIALLAAGLFTGGE